MEINKAVNFTIVLLSIYQGYILFRQSECKRSAFKALLCKAQIHFFRDDGGRIL